MITTRLKGGLGNQMFQYAAGLAMSTKFGEELELDATGYDDTRHITSDTPRKYRLFPFAISGKVAQEADALKARNPYGFFSRLLRAFNQKILRKHYIDYDPSLFKKKHSYIEGYFQSEKNFADIKERLLEEFTLKKEFESEEFIAEKKKIDGVRGVSVHIRRGDYVKNASINSYFGTCSKEYYLEAMNYIQSKVDAPLFYFFSDDIAWAKQEFGENPNNIFVSDGKLEDYEELVLMSLCAHNILANSSFSWWGAWLNSNASKIVIAPKKWSNIVPDPQPNLIPPSWVRI